MKKKRSTVGKRESREGRGEAPWERTGVQRKALTSFWKPPKYRVEGDVKGGHSWEHLGSPVIF